MPYSLYTCLLYRWESGFRAASFVILRIRVLEKIAFSTWLLVLKYTSMGRMQKKKKNPQPRTLYMLGQYYPMFDITERIAFGHDFLFEICCDVVCLPVFYLSFSSRYFNWKLNLCVILLILVFMVPFYIGYFVVSNIRLCEYLAYGIGPTNLRLQIPVRTLFFFEREMCWSLSLYLLPSPGFVLAR